LTNGIILSQLTRGNLTLFGRTSISF